MWKKYGKARRATDDSIVLDNKATDTDVHNV